LLLLSQLIGNLKLIITGSVFQGRDLQRLSERSGNPLGWELNFFAIKIFYKTAILYGRKANFRGFQFLTGGLLKGWIKIH
jgi:hypothetical protein